MECVFCGEDTMNKVSNQPMCKSHAVEARERRDKHNEKVKETLGPKGYAFAQTLFSFVGPNPMSKMLKTTAGYHLNKMFKEKNKKEEKKNINPVGDSDGVPAEV